MNHEAQEVIDALEANGWTVRTDYSWRGMRGRTCVAVEYDNAGDLFTIGQCLAEYDSLGRVEVDSMGLGMIAYWPGLRVGE